MGFCRESSAAVFLAYFFLFLCSSSSQFLAFHSIARSQADVPIFIASKKSPEQNSLLCAEALKVLEQVCTHPVLVYEINNQTRQREPPLSTEYRGL